MNDAGKVSFVPRGDYDAEATYERLDFVFYGDNSYVAKKETKGNLPNENNEYWHILARGAKGSTITVDSELDGNSENPVQNKAIYGEIAELKNSVSNGKTLVANAITDKGVYTATDAEFQTMADNIGSIKTDPTLQEKSATLNTTTTKVELTPDETYDGLSKATVSITTQEKTATLTTSQQIITPDNGQVLSKVTVPAVTGTAAVGDVLKTKTFNSATAGISQTGTMENHSNTTVDINEGGVNADTDNTHSLVNVPKAGYYDTQSKLRVLNSDIAPKMTIPRFEPKASGINLNAFGYIILDTSKYKKLTIGSITVSQITFKYVNVYKGIADIMAGESNPLIHSFSISTSPQSLDVSAYDFITIYSYGINSTLYGGGNGVRLNNITLE